MISKLTEKVLQPTLSGQIGDLQVLDTMNVESLVQHAMLDDIVALLGSHTTGTQRVPGGLAMSCHPLLNMCNVL